MKAFELKKVLNSRYSYVVLSTSYLNPLDFLSEIEKSLSQQCVGEILFDLLLTNGNSSNRYLEGFFDGSRFDIRSFRVVDLIEEDLKRESSRFYRKNSSLLDNSVLSNSSRFLVKKGSLL